MESLNAESKPHFAAPIDVMCGIGAGIDSRKLGFATQQVACYVTVSLTYVRTAYGKWYSKELKL
jgi:hypothetical protein